MRPFEYARARDVQDAVAQFQPGAMYLGGGTNLVDLMRLGVPHHVRGACAAHNAPPGPARCSHALLDARTWEVPGDVRA